MMMMTTMTIIVSLFNIIKQLSNHDRDKLVIHVIATAANAAQAERGCSNLAEAARKPDQRRQC